MNPELNFNGTRIAASFLFALAGMYAMRKMNSQDHNALEWTGERRYLPMLTTSLLPIFVCVQLVAALVSGVIYDFTYAGRLLLSEFFRVFSTITVYYVILVPLLPLLRRKISSRACAMLWLLPAYLYITGNSIMRLNHPGLIIRPPVRLIPVMAIVWAIGFIGVMLMSVITHVKTRKKLLCNAIPVSDPMILDIWNKMLRNSYRRMPPFRLVYSETAKTPLSIGFTKRNTFVILPQKEYSKEDISLILKHELIHIGREDCITKFSLTLCTALCWFNPLMWIAVKRSSEDLELSCDETVLLDADPSVRRNYAELILSAAGEQHGFTTCLSASASALKYRLKHIIVSRTRSTGAAAVGVMFFLLLTTSGLISLSYDRGPASDFLFADTAPADFSIAVINVEGWTGETNPHMRPDDEFIRYLSDLRLERLTGNFTDQNFRDDSISVDYRLGSQDEHVILNTDSLTLIHDSGMSETFYLQEPVNWDRVKALLS